MEEGRECAPLWPLRRGRGRPPSCCRRCSGTASRPNWPRRRERTTRQGRRSARLRPTPRRHHKREHSATRGMTHGLPLFMLGATPVFGLTYRHRGRRCGGGRSAPRLQVHNKMKGGSSLSHSVRTSLLPTRPMRQPPAAHRPTIAVAVQAADLDGHDLHPEVLRQDEQLDLPAPAQSDRDMNEQPIDQTQPNASTPSPRSNCPAHLMTCWILTGTQDMSCPYDRSVPVPSASSWPHACHPLPTHPPGLWLEDPRRVLPGRLAQHGLIVGVRVRQHGVLHPSGQERGGGASATS